MTMKEYRTASMIRGGKLRNALLLQFVVIAYA